MTWETIAPRAGQRAKKGGVTVGWRKVSSARFCAVLTLSKDALALLGVSEPGKDEPRPRIVVQRNREANALRLLASDAPEAWALHWKQGCGTVALPLDGVTLAVRQPAQKVEHSMDGAGLVVTLPDWARVKPPRPAIPLVEPKPPRSAKEEEALSLLRSRVSTDQVVRATGLSPREVVRLAEQVQTERARAA